MADSDALIGQTLSHYRIVAKLGAGGMGVVYSAFDTVLERKVAIKVVGDRVIADKSARDLLLHEARAASSLNHPNICTVHEVGDSDGEAYIVMEQVAGQPLSTMLGVAGLPQNVEVRYGIQIADALAHAHEHGVIHRDLKSANAMVTPEGRIKVLDFGLAARLGDAEIQEATASNVPLTESRPIVGTLPYLAPELLCGEPADVRTDIWSLGILLYEMASGTYPFRGRTTFELSSSILREAPVPLPAGASPALRAVILRCLEKSPSERFQRASDVHSALQAVQGFETLPNPRPEGKRFRIVQSLVLAAPLLAILILLLLYFRPHRRNLLTEKDSIVLADFANSTGEPIFDDTLKQGLAVQLGQSPLLNILPEQKVRSALKEMTRSPDEVVSAGVAQEVCQRTGSKAYIAGSVANLGGQYVIGLNAINCATGDTLAREQTEATSKQQVLAALGSAAERLRVELGESLSSIQRFDVPLAQATTSSLEALKAYSLGLSKFGKGDQAGAILLFQHAIELDPDFAMAYANLGRAYEVLGQNALSVDAIRKAFGLRNRASDREKFDISSVFYQFVTFQTDQAMQNCELWEQTYPRDFAPHRILGFENALLGNFAQSAEEFRKAKELDPSQALPYAGLMLGYIALNRPAEARAVYQEAQARRVDLGEPTRVRYLLAFLDGDEEMMAKFAATLSSMPGLETRALLEPGNTAAYFGRLGAARELYRRVETKAVSEGDRSTAGEIESNEALLEALCGNLDVARADAAAAGRLGGQPALAVALGGDLIQATRMADRLASQTSPGGFANKMWLPEIRATIELKRGNPMRAVGLLASVTPYEAGWGDSFLAAYLRGQAYLAAHHSQEAAAEFQKILDHRGVVLDSVIGALAHLLIGRAYATIGNTAKAKSAYQDFLSLWKDADPDIPILIAAKSEYARLQ
jgi:serine/threonine protein kinase/tetratricopeptide (TPR) repeat protein